MTFERMLKIAFALFYVIVFNVWTYKKPLTEDNLRKVLNFQTYFIALLIMGSI